MNRFFVLVRKGERLVNKMEYEAKGIRRYSLLDSLRGLALVSMILYHGVWNMVYIYGFNWEWYRGAGAFFWQQSTCWTFLLLSGFCWSMGRRPWKNGLMIFGGGVLVSAITLLFLPQNRVLFGVLTCIGSSILLMIPLNRLLERVPPGIGLAGSFLLFAVTRSVNQGYLGWGDWKIVSLPREWFHGWTAAYLGFTPSDFYSTDYFSLFPWFFLFLTGYFGYGLCQSWGGLKSDVLQIRISFLEKMGKHSLLIYLLHQPVLFFLGNIFWG